MTAPYYNADLLPGMIADYYVSTTPIMSYQPRKYADMTARHGRVFKTDSGNMWHWFSDHMTGPFSYRGTNTAHWFEHVQVSNEHDAEMLKAHLKDVSLCDSGVRPGPKYDQVVTEQGRVSVEDYNIDSWSNRVYFGDACLRETLMDYLRENPIPVNRVTDCISNDYHSFDALMARKSRNDMWKALVSGLNFVVSFKTTPVGAEEWCKANIRDAFKIARLPDMQGMGLSWDGARVAFMFAEETDAAKFKLFFSE